MITTVKSFSPEELATIGEKMEKANKELREQGFNQHPRFQFLFRKQIRKMAGVTVEEWDAWMFARVKALAEADRKRRSLSERLRRFSSWFRSLFRSTKFA